MSLKDGILGLTNKSIETGGKFLGEGIWTKSQLLKEFKLTPAYSHYNNTLYTMLGNAQSDSDFEALKKAKLGNDDLLVQYEVQKAVPLQQSLNTKTVMAVIQLIYASRNCGKDAAIDSVKEYFEVDMKDDKVTCRSKKQIQLR